jgi:hypothetical protein
VPRPRPGRHHGWRERWRRAGESTWHACVILRKAGLGRPTRSPSPESNGGGPQSSSFSGTRILRSRPSAATRSCRSLRGHGSPAPNGVRPGGPPSPAWCAPRPCPSSAHPARPVRTGVASGDDVLVHDNGHLGWSETFSWHAPNAPRLSGTLGMKTPIDRTQDQESEAASPSPQACPIRYL